MKKQSNLFRFATDRKNLCALTVIVLLTVFNLQAQDPCNPVYPIAGLGQAYQQTFVTGGSGVWNDTLCGFSSSDNEKVYSFVAPYSATYLVKLTSYAWYWTWTGVVYAFSKTCAPTGWTCIGFLQTPGVYGSMFWSPGTYYFLLKNAGGQTHTFYIICEPNAPVLSASTVSSYQINLSWNDVEGETGYRIYRAPSLGGTYLTIGITATGITTYSDIGLTAADDYCYKVMAFNNDTTSVYSNAVCVTTLPLPPSVPVNLISTAYSTSEIYLSWSDVTNETGYKIYRALSPGGTYSLIDSTSANLTNYYDAGLIPLAKYCYRVKAYNTGGLSYYSNESCATTTSGIEAYINTNQITVCPNPANDLITIENSLIAENEMVSIYGIQGQLLLQQTIHQAKTEIDISNLDKGVYIVRVIGNDINVSKKIIKE